MHCEQFAKIIIIKKRQILVVTNASATALPRQLNARIFWLIQLIINNKERRKRLPIRIYLINQHPYSILHLIFKKITTNVNYDRMRDLEVRKLIGRSVKPLCHFLYIVNVRSSSYWCAILELHMHVKFLFCSLPAQCGSINLMFFSSFKFFSLFFLIAIDSIHARYMVFSNK